jgi:hypothetical protein
MIFSFSIVSNMLRDWIIKTTFSLAIWAYIAYVLYLLSQGLSFVVPALFPYLIIIAIVLSVYMLILALHTSRLQYYLTTRFKLLFVVMGLMLILFAHYTLQDNPQQYIYLRDLSILYGIWITIVGIWGWWVSSETIRKIEDQKIEIIEV